MCTILLFFLTYYRATSIRVTGETVRANAVGHVVGHVTLGTLPAQIWAGVFAFLLNTRLVAGALGASNALGFAVGRGPLIFGQACTGWDVIDYLALRVRSTG